MNAHRIIVSTAIIGLLSLVSACNWDKSTPGYVYMDDMFSSPSLEAYEPSDRFADGLSSRKPVAGTVARGEVLYGLPNTNEGYEASKGNTEVPAFYASMNADDGKVLYNQFCSHCHGEKGDGNGILMQREKILGVPGYDKTRLPDITPGSTYHVIMYGKNNMGAHASQLNYEERWKIIKYVFGMRDGQQEVSVPTMDSSATAVKQ